jgi:hypothetical protein
MSTPESKTKEIIKRILKKRGAFYFMPATGGYGISGASDFVGCYRGRFFSIEAKAGDNKPTALQLKFMVQVTQVGGISIWVNETDAEAGVNLLLDEIELWDTREN